MCKLDNNLINNNFPRFRWKDLIKTNRFRLIIGTLNIVVIDSKVRLRPVSPIILRLLCNVYISNLTYQLCPSIGFGYILLYSRMAYKKFGIKEKTHITLRFILP